MGERYVVSVRHGEGAELHSARLDLEERAAVLGHGPSPCLRRLRPGRRRLRVRRGALQEDVDEVELSVFSPNRTQDSQRIYTLKRELAEFRRAVTPLREPLARFAQCHVSW